MQSSERTSDPEPSSEGKKPGPEAKRLQIDPEAAADALDRLLGKPQADETGDEQDPEEGAGPTGSE